jgi:hypothetical protein
MNETSGKSDTLGDILGEGESFGEPVARAKE